MIALGPNCSFCGVTVVPHCKEDKCKWNRCPKCASYGRPDVNWVQWHKDDYINPYSLLDLEVAEPERTMMGWLEGDYGTKRPDGSV